jgi:hypothetical protein
MSLRCVSALLACVVVCMGSPAQAQKLHAVLVADVSPAAKWGAFEPNLVHDILNMQDMLEHGCPESRLAATQHFLERNEDAAPQAVLSAIEGLRANRNDTILIYYTGHGGLDDRGSYFHMAGGKLYREQVIAAAKEHGARLVVLLSDCCNSRDDGLVQLAPRAGHFERDDYSPLFQSLFVDPKGIVDVNACGPSESAFFLPPPKQDGDEMGSLFTTALTRWAREKNDERSSWDAMLTDVGVRVHLMFRDSYPDGIAPAKGASPQRDQNVFARNYPGMPSNKGVRLGITARDSAAGVGAMIVSVVDDSPATKAYDIENETYVALPAGGRITAANGRPIANAKEFEDAIRTSPQIMRLTIAGADRSGRDFLVRLSY